AFWFVTAAARSGRAQASPEAIAAIGFAVGASLAAFAAFLLWALVRARGPEPAWPPLRPGETIQLARHANQYVGVFTRAGHLALTTQRLLVHARKLNFDRAPLALELGDIREARAKLWPVKQIIVVLGELSEAFVIEDPVDIARLINLLVAVPEQERTSVVAA